MKRFPCLPLHFVVELEDKTTSYCQATQKSDGSSHFDGMRSQETSSVKSEKRQSNTDVRIVKSEINTRGHKTVMNTFATVA